MKIMCTLQTWSRWNRTQRSKGWSEQSGSVVEYRTTVLQPSLYLKYPEHVHRTPTCWGKNGNRSVISFRETSGFSSITHPSLLCTSLQNNATKFICPTVSKETHWKTFVGKVMYSLQAYLFEPFNFHWETCTAYERQHLRRVKLKCRVVDASHTSQ